jgi:hypothetical protein
MFGSDLTGTSDWVCPGSGLVFMLQHRFGALRLIAFMFYHGFKFRLSSV